MSMLSPCSIQEINYPAASSGVCKGITYFTHPSHRVKGTCGNPIASELGMESRIKDLKENQNGIC